MKLYRSIDKRLRKLSQKIKRRYLQGLQSGKKKSYYFNVRFYHLYVKRFAWLIVNLLLFRASTYRTFLRFINTKYYPHLTHPEKGRNSPFNNFARSVFGYNFLYSRNLYPVLPSSLIYDTKSLHISTSLSPVVSVIIYASNKLSYTYNCLLALTERTSYIDELEIIIVNDNIDDKTFHFIREKTRGLKYIHNPESIGYAKSINNAACQAMGEFICLLNCDVEVNESWFQPLLTLINRQKSIACVGSKLLLPDNTLAEAGGILNYTGDILQPFGRRDDPDKSRYNFIREVDYCSSGVLMIRKNDFEKVGKLDERYSTSNFAILDLCISFRGLLSKQVLYQPLSSAVQFQSDFSDEDQNTSKDNLLLFRKWQEFPEKHVLKPNIPLYRRFVPESAIVIIAEALPEFDQNSKGLRLLKLIEAFRSLNYHVFFLPDNGKKQEPYFSRLVEIGVEIIADFNDDSSSRDFTSENCFFNVKLIWTSNAWINNIYQNRMELFGCVKVVSEIHDLRTRSVSLNRSKTALLKYKEQLTGIKSNAFIASSDDQKRVLDIACSTKAAYSIPNIYIVKKQPNSIPFINRSGIIYAADFRQVASIDAATWLALEIMPSIWSTLPEVPLYLVGANPPSELLQLAGKNILIIKHTRDLSACFDKARVAVSPIRYLTDTCYTVGKALENCLPLISTSIGINDFHLENGKNVLVADDLKSFSSQIQRCYTEQALWEELSKNIPEALIPNSQQAVKEHLRTMLSDLKL